MLAEFGFRAGLHIHKKKDEARRSLIGGIQGATLGLLALLLGFTFAMAVNRYDRKRELVLKEANAIGTTFLRASLLPEASRAPVKELLLQYLHLRIEYHYLAGDREKLLQGIRRGVEIENALWNHVETAAEQAPTPITSTFIVALNEMIDTDAERLAALNNRIFAPEAMQEIVHGGTFEHYVLERSLHYFTGRQCATDSFAVNTGFYSFATRVLGTFPRHRVSIGYLPQMSSPSWMNGFDIRRGQLQFYAEGGEANYRSAENGEWVIIEMQRKALQSTAVEHLGCELALPRAGSLNLNVPRPLLSEHDRWIQRSLRADVDPFALIASITRAITELLASEDPEILRSSLERWNRRCAKLRVPGSYLRSRLATHFDGSAFAAAMGLSDRSLQLLFHEAYGVSPARRARCLALHVARKTLRETDPRVYTVQSVAEDCGFRHMGRFSRYYKELFGEAPSVTLGRRSLDELPRATTTACVAG